MRWQSILGRDQTHIRGLLAARGVKHLLVKRESGTVKPSADVDGKQCLPNKIDKIVFYVGTHKLGHYACFCYLYATTER